MAWTAPMTAVTGAFAAAAFNTHVRDNFQETAPGIADGSGNYFTVSAANTIVGRELVSDSVLVEENRTSTAYGALSTAGPAVTVSTGTAAIVFVSGEVRNNTTSSSLMSFAVSGATTIASNDERAVRTFGMSDTAGPTGSSVSRVTLNAGTNTFTAQYRVTGGTGSFHHRRIGVMPL